MCHEIMTNIKLCESVYVLKRNCEFKFKSVAFTEGVTKSEENETTKFLNFTILLSNPVSIE